MSNGFNLKAQKRNYTIINADCMDVFRTMPENFVDVVVCDPPYRTTSYGMSGLGGLFGSDDRFARGSGGFDYNDLDINLYIKEIYRVMKSGAHGYLMTNDKNLRDFLNTIQNNGLSIFKVLIWDKQSKITNMYYMNQHEYIIFFRKGRAKKINNPSTPTILSVPIVKNPKQLGFKWEKIHPVIKPTDLMRILIENSTNEGDIVLDFTMGSGTTGVAALSLNRKFIGIQIDPHYFEEASRRIVSFDENIREGMTHQEALEQDSNRLFYRMENGEKIWYKK